MINTINKIGLKYTFCAAFLTLLFISCSEREYSPEISYIPFRLGEYSKWGYASRSGLIVIDTIFKNKPTYFREGYAIVETDSGVFDFIDEDGVYSGEKFEHVSLFSEGLAGVTPRNGHIRYIDDDMDMVFEVPFAEEAGVFHNGLAKFQNNKGKWGFIDRRGGIYIEPIYDFALSFNDGLALVAIETDTGTIAGFINRDGESAIPLSSYSHNIRPFRDSLCVFCSDSGLGCLGLNGDVKIAANPYWDELTDFFHGFASFRVGDYWGIIDRDGILRVESKYSLPLKIINGIAAYEESGALGYIDVDGAVVIDARYEPESLPFFGDFTLVKRDGEYEVVDKKGKVQNNFACKEINYNYSDFYDIEKTIPNDYYDIAGVSKLIVKKVSLLEINGINDTCCIEKVLSDFRLDSSNISIDTFFNYATIENDTIFEDKAGVKTKVEFRNYSTDSVSIESVEYNISLFGRGEGKEWDLIKHLKNIIKSKGFKTFFFDKKIFFEGPFSEITLSQYYDEIILRYEFVE